MSEEKTNLPEDAADQEHVSEPGVDASDVGVSAESEAEGSSETPEEQLERIATEHDVPIEKDPEDAKAEAEGSATGSEDRDISGGDTKDDEDTASEPPD